MPYANPHAPPPRRLLRPLTLRLIALVIALMLVLLFPAHHLLTLERNDSMPSRISILYSQALLNTNPDNVSLRVGLATKLLQVGELDMAKATLAPLQDHPDLAIQWLRLTIEWQLLAAISHDNPTRHDAVQRFQAHLLAYQSGTALPNDYLESMASYWLALEQPRHAAMLYEQLSEQDPEQQYQWLALAGYWWLRAGYPERSAAAWHRAYQVADIPLITLGWLSWFMTPAFAQDTDTTAESPRREAALEALRAAQQSQQDDGVAYAREYLTVYPRDPELLDLGIRLALSHGQPEQAHAWSQRLIEINPATENLERHVTIALGLTELQSALAALTQLRQQHPDQPAYLEQLAQTQQWSGDARGALTSAERLAQQTGDARHYRWVVTLALSVRERRAAVAALAHLERNDTITLEERRRWVDLLEELGEPDAAIQRIQAWQASGLHDEALGIRLATWQEQTGRLEDAADSWAALSARYGTRHNFVQAHSQVLVRNWQLESALDVLNNAPLPLAANAAQPWQQSWNQPYLNPSYLNQQYLNQRGELAWKLGDSEASLQAYRAMFEHGMLDAEGASRLIQAAADNGDIDLAMRVSRQRWRQARDGDALIQMLYLAQRERQTALTQELLAMANQEPAQFAQSADYWAARGQQALLRQAPDDAVTAYHRALELSDNDPGLLAGMLYALMAAGEDVALRQRLEAWHTQAAQTPVMMSAMAEGHRHLGNLAQTLTWYALAQESGATDAWQQLYHADALAQSGQAALAFNMRLKALDTLSPGLTDSLQEASTPTLPLQQRREHTQAMALQAQLSGPESVHDWYTQLVTNAFADTPLQASDSDWLFEAHTSLQQPLHARYLLLRAQAQGHVSPAWQTFVVALEKNDRDTLEQLLDSDAGRTLPATDRLAIMRQLDRRQPAQALAETLTHGGVDRRRDAVELASELPHRLATTAEYRRLGDLDITSQNALYETSGERFWGQLLLVTRELDMATSDIESDGVTDEQGAELQLGWNGPRADTTLTIGSTQTDRVDRPYGGISQRWQATSRVAGTLYGEISRTSDINDRMRLLSVEDRVGVQLEWTPTARDTLSLDAGHVSLKSRETRDTLGSGYRVDAALRRTLIKGATRQLEVSLLANHADYHLNNRLPDDIARRLPVGTQPGDLLTDQTGFVGMGVTLRRGDPFSNYPTVASPRIEIGLEAGYLMPDNDIGLNARLGIGSRLFGNDSLSLRIEADQGAGDNGNTNLGASLTYQYFLGH
ncbi:tetratricopeptide repeat protein [Halomonas vilamensis]|uniref:Tetratricopeptide repeat protein n=1 Tax=Vreelandella vilamensis TaxID=531309 RepID=A0ABU1H5Y8_9GAMM|nr:tetratricopeptide repeat protein [Halomonas vilamensis]MDR5898933.1 tetratricopeptide repeat protein [Halomonas vilamensis]